MKEPFCRAIGVEISMPKIITDNHWTQNLTPFSYNFLKCYFGCTHQYRIAGLTLSLHIVNLPNGSVEHLYSADVPKFRERGFAAISPPK